MAPALTKILQNDHGIHLSSPPASVRVDSDEKATCTVELEPHMRSPDHSDIQKMWLNLCSFHSLDLCFPSSPPDTPVNPGLSTYVQTSASQCEMVPLPSPGSLASFLSFSECQRDSQKEAAVFPGVPDVFLTPVSEQNSPEACLLHGWRAAPGRVPCGGDGHCSSFPPTSVFPSYSYGKINSRGHAPMFAPQSTMHEKVAVMAFPTPPPATVQPGIGMVIPDKLALTSVSEEAVKEHLSRQSRLEGRALGLRRRLHALLGEHALLHCSQQLDGLNKSCHAGDVSSNSMDSVDYGFGPVQACSNPHYSWQELSTASPSVTELREFSYSSQVVLRGLQEALDSEATGSSSSSDEESEEDNIQRKISPDCCQERDWLEERAELGSSWSWLRLRLAELEGRIQHLTELHKHICSTKGRVVLLPNRDIQIFPLKRERTGSSYTTLDADTEPCSPARLLHNIERQSAQLSQIVNSLMPPLGFSPLSKQPRTLKGKANFTSGQREDDVFVSGSSKRRRLGARRLFKADASCVCARTRPLLTYHKRKLFTFNSDNPGSLNSRNSMCTLSSFLSSSSCSCGSSFDPGAQCSDPNCSSRGALSSSSSFTKPYSVAPVFFDSPTWPKEEWSQRPLIINTQPFSPANYNRNSSTPRHNNHKFKKNALDHKKTVMGLSPISSSCPGWSGHSRSNQRKRKKGRIHKTTDDEVVAYQLYDLGESSDEVLEESCTQAADKQASRGHVRKRQGESVYNINNIVIPVSLSKVEKLQYKDILTPSWRVVDVESLTDMEAEEEEQQAEDVRDDVFAQRHLALEQKEKLRWSSWERQNCCRHTTRSASRLSGGGTGICTSGEESAEWSCGQLDADEQLQSEEWLTQAPWEPRVFPLDADDYASLLSDDVGEPPSGWPDCASTSNASKNSSSNASSDQSACATLPSHGHRKMTAEAAVPFSHEGERKTCTL